MSAKPTYAGPIRRSGSSLPVTAVAVLLIGVVGAGLLLHAAGVVKLPFLARDEVRAPDHKGKKGIWVSGRNIPAYTQITRDDLWDPHARDWAMVWLPPEAVTADMLTKLEDIIGLVLKQDKPAGYTFTKNDFFPKGTRPGMTAGVPPGMRAMRLKAAQLPGLHGAKQGDRFDVVMAIRVDVEQPDSKKGLVQRPGSPLPVEGPYAGLAPSNALPTSPSKAPETPRVQRQRAEVRVVVSNGMIVEPIHERKEIVKGGSLVRGATLQAVPVEELVIAVAPDEVAALNEALAIGATLSVAMRSGQSGAEPANDGEIHDRIVEFEPPPPGEDQNAVGPRVKLIEVIQGGKKKLTAVPEEETPKPAEGGSAEGAGTAGGK